MERFKLKLAATIAALVAVVGGGAALAADKLTPKQESDAIVADAAKELGVTSAELEAALKEALANRVDAALAAGTITQAAATAMKERIANGEVPLLGADRGGCGGPSHRGPVDLSAAATFLGLTEGELRTKLEAGDTLAEAAQAEGKTRAGIVAALVAAAQERLAEKVAEGRITAAERTAMLAGLQARVEAAVDGELGFRGPHGSSMGSPPAVSSGDA